MKTKKIRLSFFFFFSLILLLSSQKLIYAQNYRYKVPVESGSPWPLFRRDHRNTAESPVKSFYHGDQPWFFQTAKGIFSTPVIDEDGAVYVGSADHTFYKLSSSGKLQWKFKTGDIIDSAAALPQGNEVLVPSGDGHIYSLNRATGQVKWKFDSRKAPHQKKSFNHWFEGNIALGFDGSIYAGSTDFHYYVLSADGFLKWLYATDSNNWSMTAFGDDGEVYWGSNDTFIRSVKPYLQDNNKLVAKEKWKKRTLGFIAASAAIGSDGTIYIGSFDSYFYALDGKSGKVKWKFKTNDHIYSSAALEHNEQEQTTRIFFASTDGHLYALNTQGKLLWKYDTGDAIRSSPVLVSLNNKNNKDIQQKVIYVGSSNGKIYALHSDDGTRRFSFDTTLKGLEDRNDVNSSPALGEKGLYIGTESGALWYLPYDYCLQNDQNERCDVNVGEDLPDEVVDFVYTTPGGNTVLKEMKGEVAPTQLPISSIITLKLLVREKGKSKSETIDAWVCQSALPLICRPSDLKISVQPSFPFHYELSADGKYIHLIPDTFLQPGTNYKINIEGHYFTGGVPLGNLNLGGKRTKAFKKEFHFSTDGKSHYDLASEVNKLYQQKKIYSFLWTRPAVPIPPMLASLNQIGFDYMNWLVSLIPIKKEQEQEKENVNRNKVQEYYMWAVGAKYLANGDLMVDPTPEFRLLFKGQIQGNAFNFVNNSFKMSITGINIPFHQMILRGEFNEERQVNNSAVLFAETNVLKIPKFGPYLVLAGLANNGFEKLVASGTYMTKSLSDSSLEDYPQEIKIKAIHDNLSVSKLFEVQFDQQQSKLSSYVPSLIFIDEQTKEPVPLDYSAQTKTFYDHQGKLDKVQLILSRDDYKKIKKLKRLKLMVFMNNYLLHELNYSN